MSTQTINLSLSSELLKKVDAAARAKYASRSDYVRQVLVEAIEDNEASRDPWAVLLDQADDLAISVAEAGYVTDEDFRRLAKEIREERQ